MTASVNDWDFDVAVVGGGPGGSSTATTLARAGRRVVLFERDRFPRFHIGESQLPWSNEVFETLGVREAIEQAGFVKKWGASFRTLDGTSERYADFEAAVETTRPQTYQVPRAIFDEILLRHSAKCGADIREEHRAVEARFDVLGASLVVETSAGTRQTLRVGAIVDASGRAGFLTRKLGRHDVDPLLRNIAVHAQYEGLPRASGRRAGDIRMFTRPDMGWIWLIPISDTITSVGAVIPREIHATQARSSPAESLRHYLATTSGLDSLLAEARQTTSARFEADYSYLGTQMSGDRWVAVGDATAFLDPIFSTGVLLAMTAGVDCGVAIDRALQTGDLRAHQFAAYEGRVRKRYRHFRRFAVGFYNPCFRDLWFTPTSRFGLYEAVLSVLAGNWRPSVATRIRIELFFLLVRVQRFLPLAPRSARVAAANGIPP